MARINMRSVASLLDGFNSTYDTVGRVMRDRDIAEISRAKVGEQESGEPMPEAIEIDGQTGLGPDGKMPAAPKKYTFLGQTFDTAPDEAKVNSARQLAMAGVFDKYGQVERASTLRQGVRRDALADEALAHERQVRPLQLSSLQRGDRMAGRAEQEALDADALRAEQGAWMKQRLTNPDGTQRAATPDDFLEFTKNRISALASAGKPEEATRAFQDYGAQAMTKIAMEDAERKQAVNAAIGGLQAGDFKGVAALYNRFIPDGAQVVDIRPAGAGQVEIVRQADGKPMPPQRMSLQELRVAVQAVADPREAWQMSMQLFQQRLAMNADARAGASAGREAETFAAGAPGRAVAQQVAAHQATLLDPKAPPSAREAAAAALDGFAARTGRGGGGDQPAQVRLAEAIVASGLRPDMRSALEFAMTARDKSPEALRNEIYKAALSANFGDAKRAQKTTEEAMQYLSAAPAGPAAGAAQVPPPAQREVGKVYETPRGPMVWRGTGWEPTR